MTTAEKRAMAAQEEFMMKCAALIQTFIPVMQKERVSYILSDGILTAIETPLQKELKFQIEILRSSIMKHYELTENEI